MEYPNGRKAASQHRFGENTNVDTATDPEDMWAFGGVKTIPAADFSVYISSDDAADGMDVTVVYIEKDTYFQKEVTGTLAGFAMVDLGIEAEFIQRAWIVGAVAPAGNVYVNSDNTDAAVSDGIVDDVTKIEAFIPAGTGQTLQCIHMIPVPRDLSDKEGQIDAWEVNMISVVASSWARIQLEVLRIGGIFRPVDKGIVHMGTRGFKRPYWPASISIPQKAIIRIRIEEVSNNSTSLVGHLHVRNQTD